MAAIRLATIACRRSNNRRTAIPCVCASWPFRATVRKVTIGPHIPHHKSAHAPKLEPRGFDPCVRRRVKGARQHSAARTSAASAVTLRVLHLEQRLLALHAPAIATDAAIFADHAMARNRDGYGIRRAGTRHGPAGGGLTNRLRHLAVRTCRTEWDRLQVSPHAPLKCRCADIQWQRVVQLPASHIPEQGCYPGLQLAFVGLAHGEGKLALQAFNQLAVGTRELDGANAPISGRD